MIAQVRRCVLTRTRSLLVRGGREETPRAMPARTTNLAPRQAGRRQSPPARTWWQQGHPVVPSQPSERIAAPDALTKSHTGGGSISSSSVGMNSANSKRWAKASGVSAPSTLGNAAIGFLS